METQMAAKKTTNPDVKAAPKAKAAPKTKAAPKAKATPKTEPKAKAAPKAKAEPKAKAAPKAKAEPKATAPPTAKAAPKAKATSKSKGASTVARAAGKTQKLDEFTPYKPARGERYMNDEQRGHFRELLLTWRSDLVNEVTKTVGHMKDEAANFPDPADRATQEEEFSLELRARDRERKLIKKIDGTLERISIDDYGYCDACGIEIGIQRLEARPTATLCIDCKTLAEIKERQELG
jgi:DnaK suppressor protein